MTLPRWYAILERWRRVPPASESLGCIAAWLGAWKPPSAPAKMDEDGGRIDGSQVNELAEVMGKVERTPEWLRKDLEKT